MRLHGSAVVIIIANGQQAAMHIWVKCLDASIHHFGKAGQFGNVATREARVTQQFCRAAGGHQFDALRRQLFGEIDNAVLIGDRNQGAGYGFDIRHVVPLKL